MRHLLNSLTFLLISFLCVGNPKSSLSLFLFQTSARAGIIKCTTNSFSSMLNLRYWYKSNLPWHQKDFFFSLDFIYHCSTELNVIFQHCIIGITFSVLYVIFNIKMNMLYVEHDNLSLLYVVRTAVTKFFSFLWSVYRPSESSNNVVVPEWDPQAINRPCSCTLRLCKGSSQT